MFQFQKLHSTLNMEKLPLLEYLCRRRVPHPKMPFPIFRVDVRGLDSTVVVVVVVTMLVHNASDIVQCMYKSGKC